MAANAGNDPELAGQRTSIEEMFEALPAEVQVQLAAWVYHRYGFAAPAPDVVKDALLSLAAFIRKTDSEATNPADFPGLKLTDPDQDDEPDEGDAT